MESTVKTTPATGLLVVLALAAAAGCSSDDDGPQSRAVDEPQVAGAAGTGGAASLQAGRTGGAGGVASDAMPGPATSTGTMQPASAGDGTGSASDAGVDASAPPAGEMDAGAATPPSTASQGPPCVAAVPLDRCCPVAIAASAQEVAADPCLVAWSDFGRALLDGTDDDCRLLGCPPCGAAPPTPRIAALGAGGACELVDECTQASDCVAAADVSWCCTCVDVYPRSLVDDAPCIQPSEITTNPPECASICMDICDIGCAPDVVPTCASEGDWQLCRPSGP
jgi:hypothetical protein